MSDIASKQEQVEGVATLVAHYYDTLVRGGVPHESAERLASEWQSTIMRMVDQANQRAEGRDLLKSWFGKKAANG